MLYTLVSKSSPCGPVAKSDSDRCTTSDACLRRIGISSWQRAALSLILFLSFGSAAWATAINFGQDLSGSITTQPETVSYTFAANAGDVVNLLLVTTSGTLVPKIVLDGPTGVAVASNYAGSPFGCSGTQTALSTVMLSAAGTYTILVSDCNATGTGDFMLYAQRTNNPVGASTLPFEQPVTGGISLVADSNTYTFAGNAGDEVNFTTVVTSGTMIPAIAVYNPGGALNASTFAGSPFGCSGTRLELYSVKLPTTGTYTVTLRDCSNVNSGNYELDAQKTDVGTGPSLLFGPTVTGTISSVAQSNTYDLAATAGDRVDFTLVATSGTVVPAILVYNPDGTSLSSNYAGSPFGCSGTVTALSTLSLPATGTYTVLVRDCSDSGTGNYSLWTQRTNNPGLPVSLPYGQVVTGLIGALDTPDTYTFQANANDRVGFTLVSTTGTLIPGMTVYNPDGTANSSNYAGSPFGCSGTVTGFNTNPLPTTGRYTVVVYDCQNTATGNFAFYAQRENNPSAATSFQWGGVSQTGSVTAVAQSSTYTFHANAGASILNLTVTETTAGSSFVPAIYLFDPTGAPVTSNYAGAPFGCSGTVTAFNSVSLSTTGAYTLLVQDCAHKNTGAFNLSGQCTGCLTTPTITWPVPAPITYGTALSTAQLDATASVPGTFAYTPASGTLLKAGAQTLTVQFTPTNTTLYTTAAASITLTVNKATPTITWPAPAAITFGTALSATQLDASASWIVGGASTTVAGTFVYSPIAGTVPTAGTQTLNATFTPTDTADYNSATHSVTLTVNKAAPTVTCTAPAAITYGMALSATQLGCKATVPGTFVYSPASGTVLTAGAHPISVTFTPTDTTDYTTATASESITVNKATPTITWPTPAPIIVGTALSATQLDASASWIVGGVTTAVPGKYVYSPAAGTVLAVGSSTLSVTFTPTDTVDYNSATFSVVQVVQPALVATPVFSIAGGTYPSVQLLTLTDTTPGAAIHYTTDGTTPTSASTLYSAPIRVSTGETIKAIAIAAGYTNSLVSSATYTIIGSPSALGAPPMAIGTSTATLSALVNTNGLSGSYIFHYGTSSTSLNSTTATTTLPASTTQTAANASLTGLVSKTTYFCQAVVTTSGGIAYSAVVSFTTN